MLPLRKRVSSLLVGRRINDRYKIIEKVGGGGMADVYLARDVILERYVAVKILRLDFANDEEFIRRFHREAQSATSLVHPNIVNIFDVGEEDDNIYYIVMEYVNGETLKQYIQNHSPIPVDKAADLMKQLTSAIKHAHRNNIIHRDIKPQNILIDKKGNVKITDFGIATALTSTTITHTNSMLGSVHYISPEQARGTVATKKSDIYSLGIVFFEMLTGRLPFSGESAVSIALKHLQDETPSPKRWNPSIPQSVENIILKATVKDPFYRYDDVEELEDDLLTCLDPDRLDAEPFMVPFDDEATKAIPIIQDVRPYTKLNDTNSGAAQIKNQDPVAPPLVEKKKKMKKWPIVLISLSALIVIIGILALTVFPEIFGAKDVEVPDVAKLELEEAISELEELGFKIGDTIENPDDEIPENHVIRTDPRAGRTVVEGTEVNIYVSTGKEALGLPDYTGRMFEDVVAILDNQARPFKDILKEEVHDESEAGTILSQDPEPNSDIIPEETVITFTISKGPEKIVLADLTEYSQNALKNYAESNGIEIEVEEEVFHDTIPAGFVVSQDIEPNTEIEKGSTVKVIISKGKEELPPKTVEYEIRVEYSGEMDEETGEYPVQQGVIYIRDMENTYDEPYLTFELIYENSPYINKIPVLVSPDEPAYIKIVVDGESQEQVVMYPNE